MKLSILPTTSPVKLVQERQQILDALATTESDLAAARAAVDARRAELGEAEADVALQVATDSAALPKVRAAVREAAEAVDNLTARQTALTSKLRGKNLALVELESKLSDDRSQLLEKRNARWREDYRKAARALHQVLLIGQGLALVSGHSHLVIALEEANAPDPEADLNLLSIRDVRRPDAVDRFDTQPAWQTNATAAREHDAARTEVQEFDDALKVIREIRASGAWR